MRSANEGVICGILVETEQGVKNLDTILEVAGVDLVWVGFLDLSLSMGIPGHYSHPRFKEAVRLILQISKGHKRPVGTLSTSRDQVREHITEGYQCIGYGGDIWLLQQALSEGVKTVRRESSLRSGELC